MYCLLLCSLLFKNKKTLKSVSQRYSVKKSVHRNFAKFRSFFIKKETLAQVISCEFAKFLKTPFLTEHLRWLLLKKKNNNNSETRFWMWFSYLIRGGSRTGATSKMELFVIKVNRFQPLTINTECSILDVAAVLDLPLLIRVLGRRRNLEILWKRNTLCDKSLVKSQKPSSIGTA